MNTTTAPRYTVGPFVARQGWTVLVDGVTAPRRFRTKAEATAALRNIRSGLTDAARLSA